MKLFLLLTLLFLHTPLLFAQSAGAPSIRLDALVEQALASHPELAFYEAEIAAAKGERRTAATWQNPAISAEIGRRRDLGSSSGEGAAWSVAALQSFEWPGRLALRKAIADRQVQLAEQGVVQFRAALAAEVRRRGFALFAAQRKAAAAREVAERGEELVATLVQREPAGVTPLVETRAIEAAVIKLRRETSEAACDAQRAQFALNQLRGQPLAMPLKIATIDLTFPELPPAAELIGRAARHNFALKQRGLEFAQQGFKVRLSENEAWPTIAIGPRFSQETTASRETTAGIGISLPLPLWNRNGGAIDSAHAREQQAQTALQLAQREVELKIREQAGIYELHRSEMTRWNPQVAEQLREAATLADRHYRLGAVPLATYLSVQSSYLEALHAIYATQADALTARAELELLTGSPLLP